MTFLLSLLLALPASALIQDEGPPPPPEKTVGKSAAARYRSALK